MVKSEKENGAQLTTLNTGDSACNFVISRTKKTGDFNSLSFLPNQRLHLFHQTICFLLAAVNTCNKIHDLK